ncbi:hypothetical protein CFOL_v3_27123 [Cephalotus follicularis]|uniref:DUF2470 domain-containing protein n=1 Tax=Cephalotus follicularis TaxID=3775 RepID=A0A1Q3CTW3_CEPFO|nr:hypothetical protein CFOL_v3_27123 [Cephalotus follicularis]
MHLQIQSLTSHIIPPTPLSLPKPTTKHSQFTPPNHRHRHLTCSLSTTLSPHPTTSSHVANPSKPFPAELSRTIMELSSVATLSTLTLDNWPLGVGVHFAVDDDGTPILCFSESTTLLSFVDKRSSLHVQLDQCGMRTPQCTIQGSLDRPVDINILKRLHSTWKKRFGEEVDEDLLHVVSVERILQTEDFKEDGVWVSSTDYKNASPDPLRDFAEKLVNEINANNMEDVYRFCNIYVELDFQVSKAKMIWIDRLGFDIRISSPQKGIFDVRIPFPREVTDEKGAKSSINCMSQIAWEVEKNYHVPVFKKVNQLKRITHTVL